MQLKRYFTPMGDFARRFYRTWAERKPSRQAAALAYYGMFAFAPVLYAVLRVAAIFLDETLVAEQLFGAIDAALGADVGAFVRDAVIGAGQRTTQTNMFTSAVSLIALLYAATGLFANLRLALNVVWDAPPPANSAVRSVVIGRLLSFVMVIGLGILLVLAAFASLILTTAGAAIGWSGRWQPGNNLLVFGLAALTFAIIFKVLPDVKISWRAAWIGATVTAAAVFLGGSLVLLYLRLTNVGSAFQAAGSLAVLLIGIYYISVIFLAGAVFTKTLDDGVAFAEER